MISKTLVASIPHCSIHYWMIIYKDKSLFFYPTDSLEISKIVRNFKNHKAGGSEGLTAEFLKVSLDVICDRLALSTNRYQVVFFPKILETVNMVPSFKSGKRATVRNMYPYQFYRF